MGRSVSGKPCTHRALCGPQAGWREALRIPYMADFTTRWPMSTRQASPSTGEKDLVSKAGHGPNWEHGCMPHP